MGFQEEAPLCRRLSMVRVDLASPMSSANLFQGRWYYWFSHLKGSSRPWRSRRPSKSTPPLRRLRRRNANLLQVSKIFCARRSFQRCFASAHGIICMWLMPHLWEGLPPGGMTISVMLVRVTLVRCLESNVIYTPQICTNVDQLRSFAAPAASGVSAVRRHVVEYCVVLANPSCNNEYHRGSFAGRICYHTWTAYFVVKLRKMSLSKLCLSSIEVSLRGCRLRRGVPVTCRKNCGEDLAKARLQKSFLKLLPTAQ